CLRIVQIPNGRFNQELAAQVVALLARMGPAAREARPVLRDLCLSGRVAIRFPAELALRNVDAAALDELYADANRLARERIGKIITALGRQDVWAPTPERTNFFRALPAIATLGPDAKTAAPHLVALLTARPPENLRVQERSYRARILLHAAQALGQIGDASEAVVAALVSGLLNTNSMVDQACCEALGRLGPPARAAAPALRELLAANGSLLRLAGAMALVNIAPDSGPDVVPTLRELETVPDLRLRKAANLVRWKIEREGPSPLEDLLSTDLTNLFLDRIKLLGWFGPEAKVALPELIGIVSTNSLLPLRVRAADAIRRI